MNSMSMDIPHKYLLCAFHHVMSPGRRSSLSPLEVANPGCCTGTPRSCWRTTSTWLCIWAAQSWVNGGVRSSSSWSGGICSQSSRSGGAPSHSSQDGGVRSRISWGGGARPHSSRGGGDRSPTSQSLKPVPRPSQADHQRAGSSADVGASGFICSRPIQGGGTLSEGSQGNVNGVRWCFFRAGGACFRPSRSGRACWCSSEVAELASGLLEAVEPADVSSEVAELVSGFLEAVEPTDVPPEAAVSAHKAPEVAGPASFREPTGSAPEPAPFREPTESAPEPAPFREPTESAPLREPTESAPEPAPLREPTESAPEPAPLREPTEPAPFREPTESAPEPAPFRQPTESAPEPAPFREPTESAPEPAPVREPTHSAPGPAPFREPSGSAPEPAPFREPTHSAPVQEPTHSAPPREPTESVPEPAPSREPTESTPETAPFLEPMEFAHRTPEAAASAHNPPALPAPPWHPWLPLSQGPLPLHGPGPPLLRPRSAVPLVGRMGTSGSRSLKGGLCHESRPAFLPLTTRVRHLSSSWTHFSFIAHTCH